MLLRDSENIAKLVQLDKAEQLKAKAKAWSANILLNGKVLLDPDTDPTNIELKMGKKFTTDEFEKKLLKLDPHFLFEFIDLPDGTTHKTCKRLVKLMPWGREVVCVYSIGAIPEFSVHKVNEETVVDFDLKSVKRTDLPEYTRGNLEVETDPNSPEYMNMRGDAYKFKTAIPGIKKVKVPGGELIRGWRTVLARIVGEGFASPEAVEKIFGAANNLSWQSHMGKTENKPLI